nr:SatD family protein [uncultured Methanolobus sp.]
MREKFFVVQGDVIDSRRIKDRDEFQCKLESACDSVNGTYKDDIYASFKIIKGIDEIEGVLTDISGIYKIITAIQGFVSPHKVRFSIVYGDIDTAVKSKNVEKMDGPAIHSTTDRIMELKKSQLLFDIFTGNEIIDSTLRGQINLLLFYKDKWTAREKQISENYSELKKQVLVADKLSISQQAVSNTLRKIRWEEINSIEVDLNNALKLYNNYIQHK